MNQKLKQAVIISELIGGNPPCQKSQIPPKIVTDWPRHPIVIVVHKLHTLPTLVIAKLARTDASG